MRIIKSAVFIGLGLALIASARSVRKRGLEEKRGRLPLAPAQNSVSHSGAEQAARFSLLYLLPPVWLASALADWLCHRRSRTEETAGVKESLIHILLLAEMGLPVLAVLLLEITSPVLLLMIAALLVHEATVYCDLRLAVSRREVRPIEQMVHSFMEIMPLLGVWLAGVLREEEVRALLSGAQRTSDLSLRLKDEPLPVRYRAVLLSAITLLGGVPYSEELWRTARASASGPAGAQPHAARRAISSASSPEAGADPAHPSAVGLRRLAALTGVSAVIE
jgi:hypothetical protein